MQPANETASEMQSAMGAVIKMKCEMKTSKEFCGGRMSVVKNCQWQKSKPDLSRRQ